MSEDGLYDESRGSLAPAAPEGIMEPPGPEAPPKPGIPSKPIVAPEPPMPPEPLVPSEAVVPPIPVAAPEAEPGEVDPPETEDEALDRIGQTIAREEVRRSRQKFEEVLAETEFSLDWERGKRMATRGAVALLLTVTGGLILKRGLRRRKATKSSRKSKKK